ncbi:tripartite motif-containing protein 2-like protein [Anaeramoeba ignava]|uniref:Tripartite motif-containing protein 2-like protein n=1 Tax=Anaeramoeba ignava TaxID=1746090 RepID=A0A9Q0RET0_ANAIG|nr:tripartite motif-containing protein 2-like protein [Anaeramoeba ignava]
MEFQSLTCQICFEEYSEVRKPMIICKEGHSVCEHCLKNMEECPFCRFSLTNFQPIRNRTVLELLDEMKKKTFSKNVPIWKQICKGLNLEGKCTNQDCKAHNEWVIMHFGFGTFEMNSQKVLEKSICPICKELVEPEKPAFVDCKWKFEGIKKENGKMKQESSDWKTVDNSYHVFDLEKGGTSSWKSLTFYPQRND